MKKSNLRKILIASSVVTAGLGAGVTVSVGLLDKYQTKKVVDNNQISIPKVDVDNNAPTVQEIKDGYKFSISKSSNVKTASSSYILRIDGNVKKEGVIMLLDPITGESASEVEFNPGDKIHVKMKLNPGYENYTVRDLKVFGKNPNIFIPSKQTDNKSIFTIDMPTYEDTLDKETGESWLYDSDTPISVVPSFIQASIGSNGNQVDWEHGGFYDSLNGYVFNMDSDLTWSTVQGKIYETFENEDITNPIDIYFYLNGFDLILDTPELTLDIPPGWSLNVYNNKFDRKSESGKYGSIKVTGEGKTILKVAGSVALGSSVKWKQYPTTDGVIFIDYDYSGPESIAWFDNDPVKRLGE